MDMTPERIQALERFKKLKRARTEFFDEFMENSMFEIEDGTVLPEGEIVLVTIKFTVPKGGLPFNRSRVEDIVRESGASETEACDVRVYEI